MGNIFAQNLDLNSNGKIDTEEMNFFNKIADASDNAEGVQDGQISAAAENDLFALITGTNVNDEDLKTVTEKVLQ